MCMKCCYAVCVVYFRKLCAIKARTTFLQIALCCIICTIRVTGYNKCMCNTVCTVTVSQTAEMIQSYLRAHSSRKKQLKSRGRYDDSGDESDTMDQSDSTFEQQHQAYSRALSGTQRS